MDKFRHIVVEGPIGAGKTSLARRLGARLSADLILEQPAENPFLGRFYQDMPRYALPTQLFFLFQRARMLEPLAQPDMFGRAVVADFLIDKDPLFARLTLSADELALYQKIWDSLAPQAPAPDLVIYLQAQPATLVERVKRRASGEPVQYITGTAGFRGLDLGVDRRALVPRPETEVLVGEVLSWARAEASRGRAPEGGWRPLRHGPRRAPGARLRAGHRAWHRNPVGEWARDRGLSGLGVPHR